MCLMLHRIKSTRLRELDDCEVLMRTNALIKHGFGVTQSDGK